MKLLLSLCAVALLSACDTSGDRSYTRVLGELEVEQGVQTITAPDTVQAGRAVPVTVITRGGGCEEQGDTEVAYVDGSVEILPFDQTARYSGDRSCTLLLKRFPHTVLVTFPEAGPVVVRALGATASDGSVQTRERTVVVR